MIKKLITGLFLWLLGFWIVYIYFLYTWDTITLRNWIQTYQLYTAIFFVSIIILYTLQWGNKIFRFIMFIVVLINLFILGDMFFKNNIGLNSGQFVTLFGLVMLGLAITYIGHWIRYVFMSIVGLWIAFVVLTWILPLYETIPSINDFIVSQKAKIINKWIENDGILTLKTALGTKQIPVNNLQQNDIDLSQKTQISYASKTQGDKEKLFIDLGNGSFININPQSAITLEQSGSKTQMEIIQGNIEYYTPSQFSWALQIIGKYTGKNIQDIKNTIRSSLTDQFEQKKQDFFINQIGWSMILNPEINKIIKFFINTLYTISPKTYEKNLTNYNNIQAYFGNTITGNTITGSTIQWNTGENLRSMIDNIMFQVKKWAEETKIHQRLP